MNTDILFVHPSIKKAYTGGYRSFGCPPVGLAYVAAMCDQEGISYRFIDLNMEKKPNKKYSSLLREIQPKSVGFSFVTDGRFEAFNLIKMTKEINPSIVTIAGGPHVTLCAQDTLQNVKGLDVIVRGEGEISFPKLMRKILDGNSDLREVNGISFRDEGRIFHNPDGELINDLDSLPFPAFDKLGFENYNYVMEVPDVGYQKAAPILTSRGCPFSCNFCACASIWGSKWRFRSPENVVEEIGHLKRLFDSKVLWFVDDNFNSNRKRAESICNLMIETKLEIKWSCNIRVDNISREDLELMKAAGCFSVEFGAESASPRILDDIVNKKISVDQISQVDKWCYELGILTDAQFIISHPTETYEEAKKTVDFMRTLKGKSTLQMLKVYPGTEVERIAIERGIIPEDYSWVLNKRKADHLASITGDAPLFIDKIPLQKLTELMAISWTEIGTFSWYELFVKMVKKARSPKELLKFITLGLPIISRKIARGFGKK